MQFYENMDSAAGLRKYTLRLQGGGNGVAPTVKIGQRMTMTYIATGRNTLTFSDLPGTFVGIEAKGFDDATPGNVKNNDVTAGSYTVSGTTYSIEIDFWNGSGTAIDLATTSFLHLTLVFSELKSP